MKKILRLFFAGILSIGLLAGFIGCAVGPDNSQFVVRLIGQPGGEFAGSCTYVVKDLIGSRTLEAEVQGSFTDETTLIEYTIAGMEIFGKIINKTPEKPIDVILLKDGVEVRHIDDFVEGEAYLAWYPPLTVDTQALEAKGYLYESTTSPGNVREIGYFTPEETEKIDGLVARIAPETKQQFEEQYRSLIMAIVDPAYAVRSDPFWTTTEPYLDLVNLYREKGDEILPLVFQKFGNGDSPLNHALSSLLVDIAAEKHAEVLQQIQYEDLHGRYTENGDYILPYSATPMRLAKALLAVID